MVCPQLRLPNVRRQYSKQLVIKWPIVGYPVDTVASFSCLFGFALKGPASITCLTSGSWNVGTPTCEQSNVTDSCLDSWNYNILLIEFSPCTKT